MAPLMRTVSGMVNDGVVPYVDLKRGRSASPLKNAFHASAWYLRTWRVAWNEYPESHGDRVSECGEFRAGREERNRRRLVSALLRSLAGGIVPPRHLVPDEAARARLSCQAPRIFPGAGQKPVDNVSISGSFAHAVGPSAQGSFGDGKVDNSRHTLGTNSRENVKRIGLETVGMSCQVSSIIPLYCPYRTCPLSTAVWAESTSYRGVIRKPPPNFN